VSLCVEDKDLLDKAYEVADKLANGSLLPLFFNFATKEHCATGQQRFQSLPGPLATKASWCVILHFSVHSALMTFALNRCS